MYSPIMLQPRPQPASFLFSFNTTRVYVAIRETEWIDRIDGIIDV